MKDIPHGREDGQMEIMLTLKRADSMGNVDPLEDTFHGEGDCQRKEDFAPGGQIPW